MSEYAFPVERANYFDESHFGAKGQRGMTLRAWLAGQALAGLVARLVILDNDDIDRIASRAVAIADTMIKKLEEKQT